MYKEEIKIFLFSDTMIVYLENIRESTTRTTRKKFSKLLGLKVYML